MKRRYLVIGLLPLVGCSAAELEAWIDWHSKDPTAAIEFANRPEVAADLATREHENENDPQHELTNNHAARWEEIAWCESGRQWSLVATNRTGTYGGGLMIRNNVWREYGGTQFAPTADQASKAEQIEIAERIYEDVGWGAWDCG